MYLVSTIAGGEKAGHLDGSGEEALFSEPRGICVDSKKNLYIADRRNYCIRHIFPEGLLVSTLAGKPGRETVKEIYTRTRKESSTITYTFFLFIHSLSILIQILFLTFKTQ